MKNLVWMAPLALTATAGLAGCDRPPDKLEVKVEQPWVRLPAAPGRPGAAYFTLRASGGPVALVGVSSPQAERIELHETRMEGSMAKMTPVATLQFPDDGVLAFAPGGRHAMLFGIDPRVKAGDRLSLSFTFQPQLEVVADAEVRGPGGTEHGGH
jgi:copper(I)-binding protein